VGHGVMSALIAAVCVGSYRHDRRENRSLEYMHRKLDVAVADQFPDMAFTTGPLARVALDSGRLTWTNAGHPLPLLVRGGQVIKELDCRTTLPWGLGMLAEPGSYAPTVATAALEPGDR